MSSARRSLPSHLRPSSQTDPVGPFLYYLMAECGVSPNTLAAYRSDILRFSKWRKSSMSGPLADLTIDLLVAFIVTLNERGLSPASINRNIASLSTYFRYLVLEGNLTENLARLLVAPAVWDRLPTVLSPGSLKLRTRPLFVDVEIKHYSKPFTPVGAVLQKFPQPECQS